MLFPAVCRGKGASVYPATGIDRRPTIVVEIAADRFRRQGVGTAEAAQRVSSLSDNGQSVSFQAYAAESVPSSGLTESEMQALCAYRKLW